ESIASPERGEPVAVSGEGRQELAFDAHDADFLERRQTLLEIWSSTSLSIWPRERSQHWPLRRRSSRGWPSAAWRNLPDSGAGRARSRCHSETEVEIRKVMDSEDFGDARSRRTRKSRK